jgi:signal recognition particle receptor subunit beta
MMSIDYKIVFTGPPGAGKTTAIGAISDSPPVLTDVANNDPTLGKESTTVGLDYGEVIVSDTERVRLFGTPGQERFEFMWRILATNALGLIILLDNSRPDPLTELRTYLKAYEGILGEVACVVGVGRTETHSTPSPDDVADELARQGLVFPVLAVDVRRRDDVLMLVDTVLAQVEARYWEA